MKLLSLKEDVGNDAENNEGDDFLYDFKLHQCEWAAVAHETYPVGRHLTTVFKEGDSPREQDDAQQRPVGGDAGLVELQVPVPSQRHKDVA